MTIEEIIEEAKKRYSIGCTYNTAYPNGQEINVLKGLNFIQWNGDMVAEKDSFGIIYHPKTGWAEIIEMPDGIKPIEHITYEIY